MSPSIACINVFRWVRPYFDKVNSRLEPYCTRHPSVHEVDI